MLFSKICGFLKLMIKGLASPGWPCSICKLIASLKTVKFLPVYIRRLLWLLTRYFFLYEEFQGKFSRLQFIILEKAEIAKLVIETALTKLQNHDCFDIKFKKTWLSNFMEHCSHLTTTPLSNIDLMVLKL